MRTYDHLYSELTSFTNLCEAYRKAARGKRGQPAVATFGFNLEDNLLRLQDELCSQQYRPGTYHSFYIRDPKRRLISAAPFRDRVVHHALCNIIDPIFERAFISDSYANRVGKGTHAALDRAQSYTRDYCYVLQCDVRQFFPSVDHAILFEILSHKILDLQVLWLCRQILDSGAGVLSGEYNIVYFHGDDLFSAIRLRGLPIGNLTSQFWANVYLNKLDQLVVRELRAHAYLRYVDDFLLFSNDKRQLWEWKAAIQEMLSKLRLTLHNASSTVYPVKSGIPFLGFRIYPTHRRIKRANALAFSRRLRRWYLQLAERKLCKEDLDRRIQGWVAHAEHGQTWRLRRAVFRRPVPASHYKTTGMK